MIFTSENYFNVRCLHHSDPMNLLKPLCIVILLFVFFNSKSVPTDAYGEIVPAVTVVTSTDLVIKTGEYAYLVQRGCESFNIVVTMHNSYDFSILFADVVCTYRIQHSKEATEWIEKPWGEVCIPPGGTYTNSILIRENALIRGSNKVLLRVESVNFEKDTRIITIGPATTELSVAYSTLPVQEERGSALSLDNLEIDWETLSQIVFLLAALATIIGVFSTQKKKKKRR